EHWQQRPHRIGQRVIAELALLALRPLAVIFKFRLQASQPVKERIAFSSDFFQFVFRWRLCLSGRAFAFFEAILLCRRKLVLEILRTNRIYVDLCHGANCYIFFLDSSGPFRMLSKSRAISETAVMVCS